MSETTFVEEYRKELASTGYPFSSGLPLTTATGYVFPFGAIADASVYYDDPLNLPKFTRIEKSGRHVTFFIGEYRGVLDLRNTEEVVELASENDLFGGILVVDHARIKTLQGWRDGPHPLRTAAVFCPRCLEYLPAVGVQRFRSDSGELFSGTVAIVSGPGGVFSTKKSGTGFDYVELHFVGDPTLPVRKGIVGLPIRTIVCIHASGAKVELVPGPSRQIEIVACNIESGNLFEDALRIDTIGSTIHFRLAGL